MSKFKFVKVEHTHCSGKTNWMLMIDTWPCLHYFLEIRGKAMTEEYLDLKDRTRRNLHFKGTGHAVMSCMLEKKKGRKSIVDDLAHLSDKIIGAYIDIFEKRGTILVNQVFGFCPLDNNVHKILDIIEKDEYIFPTYSKKDIRISRWPNGNHWYAKVGNYDVKINDQTRWFTYEEAYDKAVEFLESLNNVKNN